MSAYIASSALKYILLLTIRHAMRLSTKVKLYLQTQLNQFHRNSLESADCSSDFLFLACLCNDCLCLDLATLPSSSLRTATTEQQ